jgi:CPA2 family monovalent cation:H+ antiporter-2
VFVGNIEVTRGTAFAVLFFASVGMLVEPRALVENAGLVLATVAIVVVGKSLAAFVVVRPLGRPQRTAVTVAVALGQIGEFSFILAALGREVGVLTPAATQVLVATAIITITLNPLLFRLVEPSVGWLLRRAGEKPSLALPAAANSSDAAHRAISVPRFVSSRGQPTSSTRPPHGPPARTSS